MNWAFVNPLMAAGLLAVGLPIAIHFLTRARRKQAEFPPFQFLVEACAGQQSAHRLRTFLLLLMRCLALGALALVFARPFLKPVGAADAEQAAQRLVVIVDASFSMRAIGNGVTHFARAQAEAADALRGLENGSEAAVILAGAKARPLLPALSKNVPALHEALVKAQATFEKGAPKASFELAAKMLGGSAGTVLVLSDFQQSNWKEAGDLPANVVCKLRPVAAAPAKNVAVTGVEFAPANPVIGEGVEVICAVLNSTGEARRERVKLELGGIVQEADVALEPFAAGTAVFNVAFPRAGVVTGKASVGAVDDLAEDNERHIAARVRAGSQALLISDADENDRRSGAFFVGAALAPSTNSAPGLTIARRYGQDVDRGALETADSFVVVAPVKLSGEAFEIISRRVYAGAQALVFLDGPTAPLLAAAAFSPPFKLGAAVTSREGEVARVSRNLFRDIEMQDWSSVRFFRRFQTKALPGRERDALLSFADGSAALTVSSVGKGAVVFANFPVTAEGGELVGSPLFPAMIQEVLRLGRKGGAREDVAPGNVAALDSTPRDDSAIEVSGPGGKVEAQVLSKGRTTRLTLGEAAAPGIFLATQGEELIGAVAANVDPLESDMRPVAVETVKVGAGAVSVARGENELEAGERRREVWPTLVTLAAVFLALEMAVLAFWRTTPRRREALA